MTNRVKAFCVLLVLVALLVVACADSESTESNLPEPETEGTAEEAPKEDDKPGIDPDPDPLLDPEGEREPLDEIQIRIDGILLETDVPPEIIEGRTLVPMRVLFEALGAEVEWDDATRTVEATREELSLNLTIGSKEAFVDGRRVELDTPAQLLNGRTFVPLRFIGETLGFQVAWDLRVINITSSN